MIKKKKKKILLRLKKCFKGCEEQQELIEKVVSIACMYVLTGPAEMLWLQWNIMSLNLDYATAVYGLKSKNAKLPVLSGWEKWLYCLFSHSEKL